MKLKYLLTLFLLNGLVASVQSQNLVPNPSFEQYYSCPSSVDRVDSAIGWFRVSNSPDYFNSCASIATEGSVPSNLLGYQEAHSGNAYCGMYCFYPNSYREYIGAQLNNTLVTGQKYFIRFWLNLSSSNPLGGTSVGTNNFGCKLFSSSLPDTILPLNDAFFFTDSLVSDTTDWVLIGGSFIADSAYNYIVFGNFFPNANTDTIGVGTGTGTTLSYIYIDDICLSIDSLSCEIHDNIEHVREGIFQITPNPATTSFLLTSYSNLITFKVYNAIGQAIVEQNYLLAGQQKVDTRLWPKGIYFIIAQAEDKTFSHKLVIQ